MVRRADAAEGKVKIALVGKYVQLADAYKSVIEALEHGGIHHGVEVEVELVDSENFEPERLEDADGILIPGGFGERGIEGKVAAARIARENSIPYLGICLGMQIAVVEFARTVAGMDGANSAEFDPETPFPVVDLLPEQKEVSDMGGTMRLGADPVKLHEGTRAREIYGEAVIYKRHRHRYEVNNQLRRRLEDEGLVCGGTSPDERLVEMVELPDHPFFVASQFHPEFNSRPNRPEPLFREFVGAAAHHAGARPVDGGELPEAGEPKRRHQRPPHQPIASDRGGPAIAFSSWTGCTRGSSGSARSAARPGRSARSPTRSPPSCGRSGSRSARTTPPARRRPAPATCSPARRGPASGWVTFCAHIDTVPHRGPGRGRRRRRRLPQRRRDDPRRRQQGGGRRLHGAGRPPRREARRRSGSSCCSPSPRSRACAGRKPSTPRRLRSDVGFVLDHAGRGRRGDRRDPDPAEDPRRLRRGRGPRRDQARGGQQRDRRRRGRDLADGRSAGSTRRRPPTSA